MLRKIFISNNLISVMATVAISSARSTAAFSHWSSGWTYDQTFVLYDRETNSLWYPYQEGFKGIQGVYFERWLPKLDSDDTRWRECKAKHPQSQIMD